jgi:GT2 family glycosyltransferase
VSDAYVKGSRLVGHIPEILFHADAENDRNEFLRESDFLKRRRTALVSEFVRGSGESKDIGAPLVSVIIPSKDQPDILAQCVEGVRAAAAGLVCEILVVDNGSTPENQRLIEQKLGAAEGKNGGGCVRNIRYLVKPMDFHFSRMCNLGAAEAKGKLLLFLNDDVLLGEDLIAEMASRAAREYTGAVGVKLLYPDTNRIQHAGITNLPMGPVHKLQFREDAQDDCGGFNHCCRNVLAVTAACLMVEAEKFREAGGFAEELPVAFNDVDLCFRLYELGYQNVCLNHLSARHYESLSRGADDSAEKLQRLVEERRRLYERHPGLEGRDPYYSIHLGRNGLDTGIRPAWETSANRVQILACKSADAHGMPAKGAMRRLSSAKLEGCRQDDCLMLRVEDCRGGEILGYGVVLGDNNACYENTLLLERQDEPETVFGWTLEGQFRPDLRENLPDQENVALCGFWVRLEDASLPSGSYRIGMLAANRVSGLRLVNWSKRYLQTADRS